MNQRAQIAGPITVEQVAAMADGRVKSNKSDKAFAILARRAGKFEIECGWVVPEADEDDADSSNYHPFATPRARCWVGRRIVTESPTVALETYERYKLVHEGAGNLPADGERIGSVIR